MKEFAPNRERTEEGWLIYPRDATLRRSMYPEDLTELIMTHPAKMNQWLCKDIVEYVSTPGQTILDPFGGVGTTLIGSLIGRSIILVEIEDYYYSIIQRCIDHIQEHRPVPDGVELNDGNSVMGSAIAIQSDNRLALPIPCDHIVTSPPYGNDLAKDEATALNEEVGKQGAQYTKATQNLGKMNPFLYQQQMKKVYEGMVKSVRPGGTITITHRDRIGNGERVLYIDSIVSTLVKLGCRVKMLDKWKAPGSIQSRVNEKLGNEVVLDEDIICMEVP